jgi:hypothetical protein
MEVLGWLWWLFASLVGLLWSVAWFLLGGWVSTLAQVTVVVLVVFGYKYGWRQAPSELLARVGNFGRFAWGWLRSGDGTRPRESGGETDRASRRRSGSRAASRHQPGDIRINVSTCLTLLMLAGLWLAAAILR